MTQSNDIDEEKMRIHLMYIEENRVKSFKDWVFDRCECTPNKVQWGMTNYHNRPKTDHNGPNRRRRRRKTKLVRHVGGALHSRQQRTDRVEATDALRDLPPSVLRMECNDECHINRKESR